MIISWFHFDKIVLDFGCDDVLDLNLREKKVLISRNITEILSIRLLRVKSQVGTDTTTDK